MVFLKQYLNCVVIIDCLEVFLDCLTHLLARAQTYSLYKNNNTLEYLIGTPQGTDSKLHIRWVGWQDD